MVNDINTLNGALAELGETLADNISNKGVSASANDGLTTLAGKIKDIPSSKKTITCLGNFTYGSNVICNLINNEYWEFTANSSQNILTAESFIHVKGSDYATFDDTVILSCKLGAVGNTISVFSFCLIDDNNQIYNAIYCESDGTWAYIDSHILTRLSADDIVTIIVHNKVIYIFVNDSYAARKRITSTTFINNNSFKIVLTCFKNTYVNTIKEVSYEIVEGFYSNPLLDSL